MDWLKAKLAYLMRDNKLFPGNGLKEKLHNMIFGVDSFAGKTFDIVLMVSIVLSVTFTIFESMIQQDRILFHVVFYFEWFFNIFFTFEYIARIYCTKNPIKNYALTFFGIVDFLAIMPFYLTFFIKGMRFVAVFRIFRLIRVFRVFKLFSYLEEGKIILISLKKSMRKIFVFFMFVFVMVIAMGTIMYAIEGNRPDSQFTNIPQSIYWAIVTVTTVGYGDMAPVTPIGRFLASFVMLFGYAIIAVPTGIVTADMAETNRNKKAHDSRTRHKLCPKCHKHSDDDDAHYCKHCGAKLVEAKV